MASVHLNLSDDLQQFVLGRVETGQFDGVSGYIETLVARAKKGEEKIEALLIDGLESGEAISLDTVEWSRIRAEVKQRLVDA